MNNKLNIAVEAILKESTLPTSGQKRSKTPKELIEKHTAILDQAIKKLQAVSDSYKAKLKKKDLNWQDADDYIVDLASNTSDLIE